MHVQDYHVSELMDRVEVMDGGKGVTYILKLYWLIDITELIKPSSLSPVGTLLFVLPIQLSVQARGSNIYNRVSYI